MPTHAKILTALLALNVLLGLVPLGLAYLGAEEVPLDVMALISLVIRVLLLVGFLKGSEGVRMLLLIGAGFSVLVGGFGLLAAVPMLAAAGPLAAAMAVMSGYTTAVGIYMLYALRNAAVMQWMLNRALGGALDDDAAG